MITEECSTVGIIHSLSISEKLGTSQYTIQIYLDIKLDGGCLATSWDELTWNSEGVTITAR